MPREAVKKRIADIVRRAGEIEGNELFALIYQHHRCRPKRSVLKAHIWQLRKAGVPIKAVSYGPSVYRWGDSR